MKKDIHFLEVDSRTELGSNLDPFNPFNATDLF